VGSWDVRRRVARPFARMSVVAALLVCAIATGVAAAPNPAVGTTTRITDGTDGQSNNRSEEAWISANGRHVLFLSEATNLLPGGNPPGVFRKDLSTGSLERLDNPYCRPRAQAHCAPFGITAHGRYALLVVTEPNRAGQWVMLHDFKTGKAYDASVSRDGGRALSNISRASVSADGRYVAFSSTSDELVAPHSHGLSSYQVYVRDMVALRTEQVSLDIHGDQPWGGSSLGGRMSGDGHLVAFASRALDVTADSPNDGGYYAYIRDLTAGTTTLVRDELGAPVDDSVSLSYDGRFAGFSRATGDDPYSSGSFVLDRQTGTVRRASVTTAGLPARGDFGLPWLSESGDAALFLADSPDLLDDGTRDSQHFLHRFDTGQTVLVEATTDGAPMNRGPAGAVFDADAGRVAFSTAASNIVLGDDNGTHDVFLRQYVGDLTTTRASTEPDLPTPPRDPWVWFEANQVGAPAVDVTFRWGDGTPQVLACDMDGDGRDGPVTFRDGSWRIAASEAPNANSSSVPAVRFGVPGDVALCGDWDGDGRDGLAVYRPSEGGRWSIRNSPTTGPSNVRFVYGRESGDRPVTGDWDGDGRDEPAVFRGGTWYLGDRSGSTVRTMSTFRYGKAGDIPLMGDWDGDGGDGVGVRRPSERRFYVRYWASAGPTQLTAVWGIGSDRPVVGDWNTDGKDSYGLVRVSPQP